MFPNLYSERLCLRRLLPEDAEFMFAYRANPVICRYQFWEPKSLDEVSSFIDSMREPSGAGRIQLGISLRAEGKLIGDCGIHVLDADPRIAEIGVTIAPEFQSKGYATESLRTLFDFLFTKVGTHRIFASVDPRNVPSMALMQRAGMRKEGHFRQSIWFKNEWADDVVFALLASEWKQ